MPRLLRNRGVGEDVHRVCIALLYSYSILRGYTVSACKIQMYYMYLLYGV